MVSKGVQAYAYIAAQGVRVQFYVPKKSVDRVEFRQWTSDALEVESSNLDHFYEFTGRFGFHVYNNEREVTHQWVEINTLTGNLGDGTMNKIEQMRSVFQDGLVVTYGLYDAGSGQHGLPNRTQCYVTVSKDRSGWMGELAPNGGPVANKPATYFALPCPHDCGMNTMQTTDLLLNNVNSFVKILTGAVAGIAGAIASPSYARDVVYALSVTQKDSINDMLRIGARYFEFRPAKLPVALIVPGLSADAYYFVHSVIPGLGLDPFLDQVLAFLEANASEIVVVQMRRDCIDKNFTAFDNDSVDKVVKANIDRRKSSIQAATEDDFKRLSVSQLRTAHKRLVITKEYNGIQYSSWSESAYATLTPVPLVNAFDGMSRAAQGGATFTELQCQATATSVQEVLAYSVYASNAATSVLMATKASCDIVTLPWVRDNAASKFDPSKSLIFMNDWIDGATCDVAIEVSRQRLSNAA